MQIYLPIAEMAVQGEVILFLGVAVGFLSGLFGVGGGFLMTPFLIFLGLPSAIAVGTQASQLVASSLSGVLGHWGRRDVDVKMALYMLSGSVPGAFLGILIFKLFQYIGQIDLLIPVLYVVLLGVMGGLMLLESLLTMMKSSAGKEQKHLRLYQNRAFKLLPYKIKFPRSRIYVSALVPTAIGFVSGILVSLMGVGSGFLLVPAMIYILGMPSLLVAGTSLFHIFITTIIVTLMHAGTNHTVDLVLAFLLIIGSVFGAQIGVIFARKISSIQARTMLAILLLIISFRLAGDLFIEPIEHYMTQVREP